MAFSIIFSSALLFVYFTSGNTTTNLQRREHNYRLVRVLFMDRVELTCNAQISQSPLWVKDEEIFLFSGKINLEHGGFVSNVYMKDAVNSSIYFENVTLANEGWYDCKVAGNIINSYYLEVAVRPSLHILVNGTICSDRFDTIKNHPLMLTCLATRSKPRAVVSWTKVNASFFLNATSTTLYGNETYDSRSSLIIIPLYDIETYLCTSKYEDEADTIQSLSIEIHAYDVPVVAIHLQDTRVSKEIYFESHTTLSLSCIVKPTTPFLHLFWMFDQQIIDPNVSETITTADYIVSNISQKMPPKDVTAICSVVGDSHILRSETKIVINHYTFPDITITVNGKISETEFVKILWNSSVVITCNHKRGVPTFGIILQAYEYVSSVDVKEQNASNFIVVKNPQHSGATFRFHPISRIVLVHCTATGPSGVPNVSKSVELIAIELPSITVSIDGQSVSANHFVRRNREYKVECTAFGRSPFGSLTWKVEKSIKVIENSTINDASPTGIPTNATFRVSSYLKIVLLDKRGMVTCQNARSDNLPSNNCSVKLLEMVAERTGTWIVSSASILIVIGLFISLVFTLKRCKGSSVRLNVRTTNENQQTLSTIQGNRFQQRSELPQVPKITDNHSEAVYSKIMTNSENPPVCGPEDITFILKLSSGKFLDRWMGTRATVAEKKECVLISIAEEAECLQGGIHWEAFVQKILELPTHENVTNKKGIFIDEDKIYLLQEYIPSGNLKAHLQRKTFSGRSFLCEILYFAIQVINGIEFIVNNGFSAPGLRLTKVLLTKAKYCKIYDFCLIQDTPSKIMYIKQQVCPVLLPSESEQRNEYTSRSESWSLAVFLVELLAFAFGCQTKTTKNGYTLVSLPTCISKDDAFFQNILETVLECYTENPFNRPQLFEIKHAITKWMRKCSGENSFRQKVCNDDEHPGKGTKEDGEYMPMFEETIEKKQ